MTMDAKAASNLFREDPEGYLDVGGAEVAYRRAGTGPNVLFVHGWPVSGATFRMLLPQLVDQVTCHVIDLPGAGSSRFTPESPLSIARHVESVRRVVDLLGLDDVAVVGHDSGGLIARHAMAADPRLRAMALIDTELSTGTSWKFRSFLAGRHVPGFGPLLGWVAGKPTLRRSRLMFGDAFVDRSLLDGEFDEFFLRPLHTSSEHLAAATRLLKSFNYALVDGLGALHRRIEVPVLLVWGRHDRFFPIERAAAMVDDFATARLEIVDGAALFAHEERPEEVARALLTVIR